MKLKIPKSFILLAPGNSLRKRTAYSLAFVRLILVPVIVLAVYYLFRMGSIVDRIVNIDAPAASLAQQASINLLEARRAERNYFLLHDPDYLDANHAALQQAQAILVSIRDLEPDEQSPIQKASAAIQLYQDRFAIAVSALQQPGQTPTDRMRDVIRAYEEDLDSLLKGTKRHTRAQLLDELRKRVGSFDSQISATVQAGSPELHGVTEDLQTSSEQILTVTSELESQNWARVQEDHAAARHLLFEAEVALSVVSFFTLIVSIWLSYYLPGQIVKPLVNLKEAVDHATLGNYGIEFDVQGKGETVELARSLQQLFAAMQRKVSSQRR